MPWKLDPNREQTVLLPFDFSEPAIDALATARDLVARTELLWVLHVVPPLSTTSPGFLLGEVDLVELRERADTALAKTLSEIGIGTARRRIVIGDPASEIVDVAREIDADLIVIPSRGKTGLRRWMIGSVAEKVVRRAPCPVLVLPIDDDDDDDDDTKEEAQS
ncbi:MAG TPA: universal stress protein [Enhygromyxa sp.]|nr:universal stress protein [Enhygromyxa sp.]